MDQGLRDRLVRLHRGHVADYGVVSDDPPIFYVLLPMNALDKFLENYGRLFSYLRGRRAYCLCGHGWHISSEVFEALSRMEEECRRTFPDVELIHLCNEPEQDARFRANGSQAVFCNHNCFVDERIFRPLPQVEKRFDAVYDARFASWKRHGLAGQVRSLALIYYPWLDDDQEIAVTIRGRLFHAHLFNEVETGVYQRLSPMAVNRCLNACRVGLCLSEEEGAMYASAQYLLSGLPVVTTPSRGGRDVLFEEPFVLTVPARADAVDRGVEELIGRNLDPGHIREATLAKVRVHRETFVGVVQKIYERHGVARRFADEWSQVFYHRMCQPRSHLETIARLSGREPEGDADA